MITVCLFGGLGTSDCSQLLRTDAGETIGGRIFNAEFRAVSLKKLSSYASFLWCLGELLILPCQCFNNRIAQLDQLIFEDDRYFNEMSSMLLLLNLDNLVTTPLPFLNCMEL